MKAKPSQAKRILRLTGEADIPVILVIGYPDSVEMPLGLGSSSSAVISEQLQLQLQLRNHCMDSVVAGMRRRIFIPLN